MLVSVLTTKMNHYLAEEDEHISKVPSSGMHREY
jgi:hypothetical protein